VSVHVDPITLDLHFQRLEFATGFDVRALIEERDAWRDIAEQRRQQIVLYEEALAA
jgi:hypothetical protein